jgi:HK97 gp10 family phage protein
MSIEFGTNVEGIEELQRAMEHLPEIMRRQVRLALEQVGRDMHMDARRMCPVKTGRLRDSIFSRVEDWLLRLGATAPYAIYQELGTRHFQGRFFLTEAIQLNFPSLKRVLDWAIDTALKAMAAEAKYA